VAEPYDLLTILKVLPAIGATIWFSLAALQVYRDRIHTWTEAFFLGACFFTGAYALSDLFFFNAPSAGDAANFARLSMSCLAFAPVFFFLFTQVYVGRMHRAYLGLFAIPFLMLYLVWTSMVVTVDQVGAVYRAVFEPVSLFAIWLIPVVVFASAGIINLVRVYRTVRATSRRLARRAGGLVVTFVVVFFLGLVTNGLQGVLKLPFPPPFSTLLAIPGALAFAALYPGTRERISEAMRRFRAKRYTIQSGFLIFNDGTLIDSMSGSGESIDRDLFSATLDVIQNFMRTSFPILAGTSLRTIEHGDMKILLERTKQCYLAIVLSGEENDLLRRQMRDELLGFEDLNRDVLAKWRGVQEDARGAGAMLRRLLQRPEMFPQVAQ